MKFILALVALVALAGFASTTNTKDLIEGILFIECARGAMRSGVSSIPIPKHDPLEIVNPFFLKPLNKISNYSIILANATLYNLVAFQYRNIDAISYKNPERVAYNYTFYWPRLQLTGNFDVNETSFGEQDAKVGTFNVEMREVFWSGIFNLTKPGQEEIKENLDALTLNSKAGSVKVTVEGIDSTVAATIASTLQTTFLFYMNNLPPAIAEFIRVQRINGFWLKNPDKIDQLIEFCNIG